MKNMLIPCAAIVACLIIACSSRHGDGSDSDSDTAARSHPFNLKTTDSSIIARYVWPDTMAVFAFQLFVNDSDGANRQRGQIDQDDLAPLVRGNDYELKFTDFKIDALPENCTILFLGSSGINAETEYGWRFMSGKFVPTVYDFTD